MSAQRGRRPSLVADRRRPAKAPAAAQTAKGRAGRRRRPGNLVTRAFGWALGLVWAFAWRVALVTALIVGAATYYFYTRLPPVAEIVDGRNRGSVTMVDTQGEVFAWRGETFGGPITPATVSRHLRNAIIATEDRRFYRHFGLSPRGIAGAIRINLSEGRGPFSGNGGSTITQQTAKLLCLGVAYDPAQWPSEAAYEDDCREGSLWRKAKEAVFALAMEARYTKDEILTIYLNRAYLGAGARGFEAAAQRYFSKSATEVSPAEAAMLAGLLVAPSTYAPTRNLERARARANLIIGLMEEQGYLTRAEAADARAQPAQLSEAAAARAGGAFADWLMETGPAFLTRDTTEDVIIKTTLDPRVQRAAEEALAFVFQEKVREGSKAQAAIVVMSADGAVRAMVGGRGVAAPGSFNRATQAKRQTGSSFKPFVYAAALDMGWSPLDRVVDEPITIHVRGSGPWSPRNYTNDFKGSVTLTRALAESLNIPAVKVSEAVGRDAVRKVAEDFGIVSELAVGPALALGTSEATLLEMTGAYAGILNGGRSVRPYGMVELHLRGDPKPLFGQTGGMGERVISDRAAGQLVWMLTQVIERGTGTRARLPDRQAAGKTGTTQAARDAWFLGFTADYVVGVWMGYDDNTPLTGVTGGGLPAEIWREVMLRVNDGLPARPLPMIAPDESVPEAAGPGPSAADGGGAAAPAPPQDQLAEDILLDVLNQLLGSSN